MLRNVFKMRGTAVSLLAASLLLVPGCLASGPEKALSDMAQALNKNDAGAFLARIDGARMARYEVQNFVQEDRALSMLDSLGERLRLGGVQDLLGQVMDVERELLREYQQGVSTGTLMAECRAAPEPGCPWVPESLEAAEVKEISPTAAIARVVTPARMTSWLALQKQGEQWRVVGKASLESTAKKYAQDQGQPQPAPEQPGKAVQL